MRSNPTEAERALWRLLRGRRRSGLKFRRQVPIGPYIVDFLCLERRLIVEADGGQHGESVRDATRDADPAAEGWQVIRFWNHEIFLSKDMVLDTILARAGLPW
ncbi:MAG: endonuclease domain-containing protein [Methylobacteriaceae bacterium]|nr:endonuclease domain-containing protein [Methylobacteriaceae bacterium]MBV9705189.1 endonuclease domain-containing protein [Methylobacteriaceae bacterium]